MVYFQIQAKTEQDIRELTTAISSQYANLIKGELESSIGAAKAMAASIANERAQKTPSRERVIGILRKNLETFPNIFGSWTAWEPDAF
ncbi:hypothetical protein MASR1M90_12740 [Desulfovibrionales bacterium]